MASDEEREILELLAERDETELTTPEVATALDISKPGAWQRLTDLSRRGLVERHVREGLSLDSWSLTETGRARVEE